MNDTDTTNINTDEATILNNADFTKFVHGDVMNTFLKGKMNRVVVDDGAGF